MNTESLSTLKIHKLSQEQYDRELEAGRIDENALYLTPDNTEEKFAPLLASFDESWGHNRLYYLKNALINEETGKAFFNTVLTEVEIPSGKSIMVCALSDDNDGDYSYIDSTGACTAPPSEFGWEGALATPTVSINGTIASWNAIEGATSYNYIIGDATPYHKSGQDELTFANTYNRLYVERTKGRGVYSRYAMTSVNAPKDPDPADYAQNVYLDSIPMRMSNGYIMAPIIKADNQKALDKIAERGYNLDYYLMPKSYTDSYTEKYVTENVPITLGDGENSIISRNGALPYKITGKLACAFGENHEISGLRGFTAGYTNKVTNTCGAAFGQNVENNGWLSFGAGNGLKILHDKQSVFGEFNNPIQKDSMGYRLLHSIGNGTSDSNRKNAFEVYADGRATIGRAPVFDMDVANKAYVDTKDAEVKSYVDTKISEIPTSDVNKSYVDTQDQATKTYANGLYNTLNNSFGALNDMLAGSSTQPGLKLSSLPHATGTGDNYVEVTSNFASGTTIAGVIPGRCYFISVEVRYTNNKRDISTFPLYIPTITDTDIGTGFRHYHPLTMSLSASGTALKNYICISGVGKKSGLLLNNWELNFSLQNPSDDVTSVTYTIM